MNFADLWDKDRPNWDDRPCRNSDPTWRYGINWPKRLHVLREIIIRSWHRSRFFSWWRPFRSIRAGVSGTGLVDVFPLSRSTLTGIRWPRALVFATRTLLIPMPPVTSVFGMGSPGAPIGIFHPPLSIRPLA